jgi:hypothetical protein
LQVLNTVLIAEAVAGRDPAHIAYENMITRPATAIATIAATAPDLAGVSMFGEPAGSHRQEQRPSGDDTFATTTGKTGLAALLRPADAAVVSAAKTASLAVARALMPGPQADQAEAWLAGDHLYRLEPPRQRPIPVPDTIPAALAADASFFVWHWGLEFRNTLVSNAEFARFMNALAGAGMPNGHRGTWLLACEMPHERVAGCTTTPRPGSGR